MNLSSVQPSHRSDHQPGVPTPGGLPLGVEAIAMRPAADGIGHLVAADSALSARLPRWRQWNLVTSHANTLRGVHVHLQRHDCLVVLRGSMWLGVHDLRADSPTCGQGGLVHIRPAPLQAWVIPPGVGHGFCFTEDSLYCYGLSRYWVCDSDDFACRWDDPGLGLPWPVTAPRLSPRDAAAGSLAELIETLAGLDRPRPG